MTTSMFHIAVNLLLLTFPLLSPRRKAVVLLSHQRAVVMD